MNLKDFIWQFVLAAIVSYFIGNINSAVIISKRFKHQDIRQQGSKNPGTTNMMRVFGIKMGAVTLVCDMIKGIIPILISGVIFKAISDGNAEIYRFVMYLSAFSVTVGHVFPVFMGFKGGKGFATSVGIMLVIQPLPTAVIIVIGLVILLLCDRMSVFALFYVTAELLYHLLSYLGVFGALSNVTNPITLPMLIVVALFWVLLVFAHRSNILRLLQGKESPSGLRKGLFGKKDSKKQLPKDDSVSKDSE